MSNVINLADEKFLRTNAGKIVAACNILDAEVERLVFSGQVPANEVIAALCQRIGVYMSKTDADIDKVVPKLARIIHRHAKKPAV